MTFSDAIKTCFQKYATFAGRASRSEYWYFILFMVLVNAVARIVDGGPRAGHGALQGLVGLLLLLPHLAVAVRRLHDTDRSGWWYLLPLLTLPLAVGAILVRGWSGLGTAVVLGLILIIVQLIWFCQKGTAGGNRYGDDPLEA